MSSPHYELKVATFQRMRSDPELMSMVREIGEVISDDTPTPYIVIGETMSHESEDTFGSNMLEISCFWDIWNKQNEKGSDICNKILGRFRELFHRQPLELRQGYRCVQASFQSSDTIRDEKGRSLGVSVCFNFMIEKDL